MNLNYVLTFLGIVQVLFNFYTTRPLHNVRNPYQFQYEKLYFLVSKLTAPAISFIHFSFSLPLPHGQLVSTLFQEPQSKTENFQNDVNIKDGNKGQLCELNLKELVSMQPHNTKISVHYEHYM